LQESADLDHKVPPSPVIHVRGLPEHVTDNDLRQAVTSFGAVRCVRNLVVTMRLTVMWIILRNIV